MSFYMLQYKSFAVDLARKSGALLKEKFNKTHTIHYKGEINLVTEADKLSEDLIIGTISRNFPDHGILSEESPATTGAGKLRWIIDPWMEQQITLTVILFFVFQSLWKMKVKSF